MTRDDYLPGYQEDRFWYMFGRVLLPWWGIGSHEHMTRYLLFALGIINETATAIATQQKEIDSVAKVVLDNHIALHYILAEHGGVCATSYFVYINASAEVETHRDKIWLQQVSSEVPGPDCFSGLFSHSSGNKIYVPGLIKIWVATLPPTSNWVPNNKMCSKMLHQNSRPRN